MNIAALYDRMAGPALPHANPYDARLRSMFLQNADQLLRWIVDAEGDELGTGTATTPFPMEALLRHIKESAVDMPGEILTRVVPHDRLAAILATDARDMLGTMMVDLMVLHVVRAANHVAVGIANETAGAGRRIDATSPARRALGITIARTLSRRVRAELAGDMPALTGHAIRAATAWTMRDKTIH